MKIHRVSSSLVWLLLLSTPLAGQSADHHQESPSFTVTQVAGPISMLQGKGGNIGLSQGPDGLLLVDADFAEMSAALARKLEEMGGGQLRFVLNTHWHSDHTGGNPALGRRAPIIAHANVRKRVSADQQMKVFSTLRKALPKEGWPVITFDQGLSLHFNGEEIRVMHYPHGHTDGDAVVFFTGSQVVHTGDLLFAGSFPFIDLENGGDVPGLIADVKALLEQLPEEVRIIPGHGPLSSRKDLQAYYDMLTATADHVLQQKKSGKTLAQITAAGLPERWRPWSGEFVNEEFWIRTLYNGLPE